MLVLYVSGVAITMQGCIWREEGRRGIHPLDCLVNVFYCNVAITMPAACASFVALCMTQVPSQEEEESLKSLQRFVEELPVLELVGKVKHIQPDQ